MEESYFNADDSISLGTWFEYNGLRACKIEACFTVFKLSMIYGLISMPFLFELKGESYDLDVDIVYSPNNTFWYVYITVTYLIMASVITDRIFDRMKKILSTSYIYTANGLDINDPRGITIDEVIERTSVNKEELLTNFMRLDNFLIGLDENERLNTRIPFFRNLLTTLPFEIAIKEVIGSYFLDVNVDLRKTSHNQDNFKEKSIKMGLLSIPFLPVLFIFTLMNHILTYSNNGNLLSLYSYNRYGVWKLRLYNEFESRLKTRLQRTHGAAEAVLSNKFVNSWKASGYKFLSFITGSLTTIGIYMSFHGYMRVFGMDIIPVTGLLAMISAITYPRVKTNTNGLGYLKRMLKSDLTVEELQSFFSSKISILLHEVISIPLIPIVLIFLLPNNSYYISEFFTNYGRSGYCSLAKFENRGMSAKGRRSFTLAKTKMGESDLLVSI